jgi:hypothetical protein
VELPLFEEVADALRGLVPPQLGELRQRPRRYGIKVWFGPEKPPREHYEAQVIGARDVPAARVLALEIGFHAEHPAVDDNDAVIARLLGSEKRWRSVVGKEAEVGGFLGRADQWRRVSETWLDPDLSDVDLASEVAFRLVDYITALEPLRRKGGSVGGGC